MCFGTFDLLHPGHLNYFEQAKRYGYFLIVVIARDKTKQKQGKMLMLSEKERLKIIQSIKMVDKAVLGSLQDFLHVIIKNEPAVICLGYDHAVTEKDLQRALKERGLSINVMRMKAYKKKIYKSTLIKKKIKEELK